MTLSAVSDLLDRLLHRTGLDALLPGLPAAGDAFAPHTRFPHVWGANIDPDPAVGRCRLVLVECRSAALRLRPGKAERPVVRR
ncbi:hypothetical protein ABT090_11735 [Streptomyces asoensis]|uniref:hypothetical protein n=1 Tax=Streptomyces asoensis TaxID=249586 RepID=UPI0033290B62